MALTLGQGAQLAAHPGYQARIRAGIIRYAGTVMAEPIGSMTSTVFAKRKLLASRVLMSASSWQAPFTEMVGSDPGASLTWFNPVSIVSSTNANPTVITTAAVHGLVVGDVVEVTGHLVNTNADGTWVVSAVGSTTTFTIPQAANAGGAATGTSMEMESDVTVNFTIQNNWNAMAGTYAGEA